MIGTVSDSPGHQGTDYGAFQYQLRNLPPAGWRGGCLGPAYTSRRPVVNPPAPGGRHRPPRDSPPPVVPRTNHLWCTYIYLW